MGGESQGEIGGCDSAPVVHDADEFAAAVFGLDENAGCAGVDCILDELFHDGGGALDHLAGGDAVDEGWGELMNASRGHGRDYRTIL